MPVRVRLVLATMSLLTAAVLVAPKSWTGVLQSVVELSCVAIAWIALWPQGDLMRKGWGLIVLAVTLLGLSDVVAVIETQVFHYRGFPRPSNLVGLVGYGALAAGVVVFERRRTRVQGARPGGIEAFIFGLGGLAPDLVFLVLPQMEQPGPFSGKLAVTAYALADLVVLAAIARLLLTDSTRSRALVYLSLGLLVSLFGDFLSGVESAQGPSSTIAPVKVLWMVGYLFFAAGMAQPKLRNLTYGTDADPHRVTPRSQVWLLAVGSLLPGASLAASAVLGDSRYLWVIAVIGLVVSALVAARLVQLMGQIGKQSEQLSLLARHDELTRLPNRRSWNVDLSGAAVVAHAGGTPLSVALLDLDEFKAYNDTFGHPAGDRLLRRVADVWSGALLGGEVLARYGGEEFALILPGLDLASAAVRVEELRSLMPAPQTASAGVAQWRDGTDPVATLAEADGALYLAKRNGRDQTVAAQPDPDGRQGSEPGPLRDMRSVVQPIVRLDDLAIVGYEGLSRFAFTTNIESVFDDAHHKGYGDLLEVSALRRILDQPDRPPGAEVFVNVTERAMRSDRFWELLPGDLTGVVIELCEQRDGLDDIQITMYLDRFRRRGARIGLDDVGSSATDFARIVSLDPHLAKIDRSLVSGCDLHPSRAEVLRMLCAFAAAHGVEVCVEGVETAGELATVRAIGATYAQGYLLGRPDPTWRQAVPDEALAAAI